MLRHPSAQSFSKASRVRWVYSDDSMSKRMKLSASRALRRMRPRFSARNASEMSWPSAVNLSETLAVEPLGRDALEDVVVDVRGQAGVGLVVHRLAEEVAGGGEALGVGRPGWRRPGRRRVSPGHEAAAHARAGASWSRPPWRPSNGSGRSGLLEAFRMLAIRGCRVAARHPRGCPGPARSVSAPRSASGLLAARHLRRAWRSRRAPRCRRRSGPTGERRGSPGRERRGCPSARPRWTPCTGGRPRPSKAGGRSCTSR